MGVVCSIKKEVKRAVLPPLTPKLFYLNLKKKSIIKIEQNTVSKVKMPKFALYPEAAVGNISDSIIIVGGGKKPNECLSKKVCQLDGQNQNVTKLPSLQHAIKGGNFYYIMNTIYYISSDLKLPHQRLGNNKWEEIRCSGLSLHSATILVQEYLVYFFFAIKPNGKPTKRFYCMDLRADSKYTLMKHKLNFKLRSPVAVSSNDFVVIAGGFNLNGSYNNSIFVQKAYQWKEIHGPECTLLNYPCIFTNNLCVFIAKSYKILVITPLLAVAILTQTRDKNLNRVKAKDKNKFKPAKLLKYRKESAQLQELLNNMVKTKIVKAHSNERLCVSYRENSSLSEDEEEDDKYYAHSSTLKGRDLMISEKEESSAVNNSINTLALV